ncbi:MAG: hypothetical protein JST16_18105 [Bdellovibrionales bacterium]|nr:hypothetical protein [Bdellovibrionales bacterium]
MKNVALPLALLSLTASAVVPEIRNPASVPSDFGRAQVVIGREDCVAIQPWPGYQADEDQIKDEDKLCQIKFEDPHMALCPKLFSTNPGVEIYSLPANENRDTFVKTECKKETARAGEKEAKFKQTTSCSHTSSILGYNKLAAALGVHLEVPVSVYRTMEIRTHEDIEEIAHKYAEELIGQTWAGLTKQVAARNPKVVKDSFVYGALVDNPRGETRHPFLNRRGAPRRAAPFLASPTWAQAINPNPINKVIAPALANVGAFVAVRDSAEMAVMDHIMAQQDRFGNIAAKKYIYWIEKNADGTRELKSMKASKAAEPIKGDPAKTTMLAKLKAQGIPVTEVQRMILKDNDCGLREGDNDVRNEGMLKNLHHINPSVYENLQKMAAANDNLVMSYLEHQLLMSVTESKGVWTRLNEAADILKANCKAGKLHLDLEADSFLGLAAAPVTKCE